jgi:hypothetical protein
MLTRKLMVGLALTLAASVTGCSCCKSGCNTCASPGFFSARPAPCNTCGPAPVGGVALPPPPAAVVPGPAPAPGPYGASYERRT